MSIEPGDYCAAKPEPVMTSCRRPPYLPGPGVPYPRFAGSQGRSAADGDPSAVRREGQGGDVARIRCQHFALLRGDGGEYRVRYMVDDDDMQWIDSWVDVALTGWLPGKHTLRVELIGPDGWPVRNGDFNIETQEILISSGQ